MPFTFKLSQRLARMRHVVALLGSAAAFAACEKPTPTESGTQVAAVNVSPDTAELLPSQRIQLIADGRSEAGDSVPVNVTWSASAGSISQHGLYTAPESPGRYQVCGQSDGLLSCAQVLVVSEPTTPVATPAFPPALALNAADSFRAKLPLAQVAVVVPVEVREDSDVVVRLILDPSRTVDAARAFEVELAAGMYVEGGTAFYSPTMSAQLLAPGATVTPSIPSAVEVPSRTSTMWRWVLHPTDPGPRKLLITLGIVGASPAGAQLPVYYFERDYKISRNWKQAVATFIVGNWWQILVALGTALSAFLGWVRFKKRKASSVRR